jgi:hypothetical protein
MRKLGWGEIILQEHRGPATVFSLAFRSHVQFMADCWPHEHLAVAAQTQPSPRPQQVDGLVMVRVDPSYLIGFRMKIRV